MSVQDFLRIYFQNLDSSNSPFKTIDELTEYLKYDQYLLESFGEKEETGFLKNFDETLKLTSSEKAKRAAINLAKSTTSTLMPDREAFYNALADSASSLTFNEIKRATVEGLKESAIAAGGIALGAGFVYALFALGGLYFMSKART